MYGVDVRPEAAYALMDGKNPYFEHNLDGLLQRSRSQISALTDGEEAASRSDASFIIVPTPSEPEGNFSTRFIEETLVPIGNAIRNSNRFHLVSVVSTVLPGSMDLIIKPLLEETSEKKCGMDFGLCYNPEFIALGDVVRGLLTPDFVLIGEADPRSGDLLSSMYQKFCKNKPPISRMTLRNAELAKISLNVYVTMKVTFANTLAAMCENMPGGNVEAISDAIGLDSRIGRKYLTGGLGYGGPCFPRDNRAFSYVARKLGNRARISELVDELNEQNNIRVGQRILETLNGVDSPLVSILGLTYKPNTDIVEESGALRIAEALASQGINVRAYDPMGVDAAKKVLGARVEFASNAVDCIKNTDLCVITTPWEEFRKMTPPVFVNNMNRARIIDCWRILDRVKFEADPNLDYMALGVSSKS